MTTDYNNMQPTDVAGTSNYVPSMTYDSAGRLLTRALGNGLTQTYHYYAWNEQVNNIGQGGRLETLVTGSLQNLSYVYDQVGNISQITNSAAGENSVYGYDALDRLTSWQLNQDTPEAYAYDSATGNLDQKGNLDLQYLDSNHIHAVTNANSNTYSYDSNGNQITRHIASDTFNLIYDAENRLVEVKKNSATIAQFTFDGDGKRVMSVMDGETILFVGSHFEQKGSQATKYYFAGASRVAIRKYTIPQSMTVEYLLGDHLGSTSVTTDANGVKISELRYKPWGELRYSATNAPANTSPAYELVKYQYTGQYSYDVEFGLKYYNARWLDSTTGRFTQPDTLVPAPNNTQSWDRFAYVGNNPCNNTDPDGHCYPLCTMAIGALVGAVVGGAAYAIANKGNFDTTEFAVAVGVGLVAGGLVGTGIGIGMAAASGAAGGAIVTSASVAGAMADASMAISAGTAGLMTGGTYIASNPDEFETGDFLLQTGFSMAAGAASGDPSAGYKARAGMNIIAGEVSYFTNGEDTHSIEGAVITATTSAALSIPGGGLPSSGTFVFPYQTAWSLGLGTYNGFISSASSNMGSYLGCVIPEECVDE